MKIVDSCPITGRGEAIFTDEVFTPDGFAAAREKTKMTVAVDDRIVELVIISAETVLKGDREFLAFVVPFFSSEATRVLITNREIKLA